MQVWLFRILGTVWAGFWFTFGVGWAVQSHLPWQDVLLSTFKPGFMFAAIVAIAWFWPRIGGVLLVLTGFVLAGWYAIYFGQMPVSTKLFVLGTFALPPLVCGLIRMWPSGASRTTQVCAPPC